MYLRFLFTEESLVNRYRISSSITMTSRWYCFYDFKMVFDGRYTDRNKYNGTYQYIPNNLVD